MENFLGHISISLVYVQHVFRNQERQQISSVMSSSLAKNIIKKNFSRKQIPISTSVRYFQEKFTMESFSLDILLPVEAFPNTSTPEDKEVMCMNSIVIYTVIYVGKYRV